MLCSECPHLNKVLKVPDWDVHPCHMHPERDCVGHILQNHQVRLGIKRLEPTILILKDTDGNTLTQNR